MVIAWLHNVVGMAAQCGDSTAIQCGWRKSSWICCLCI